MKTIILTFIFLITGILSVAQNANDEQRIKGIFIYNFIRMTQWPADHIKESFNIGIYGNTPMKNELIAMSKTRGYGNIPITIIDLGSVDDLQTYPLHIIFIPQSQSRNVESITQILKGIGAKTLVITENNRFPRGSVINFVVDVNRITYQVSNNSGNEMGIRLSSDLLRLGIQTD